MKVCSLHKITSKLASTQLSSISAKLASISIHYWIIEYSFLVPAYSMLKAIGRRGGITIYCRAHSTQCGKPEKSPPHRESMQISHTWNQGRDLKILFSEVWDNHANHWTTMLTQSQHRHIPSHFLNLPCRTVISIRNNIVGMQYEWNGTRFCFLLYWTTHFK